MRRRTRAAVSVTLMSASRARRHVRGIVAFVRNLIAALCPRTTSCRRVAILRRTHASVSTTFILASRVQRHIHDLIAFVRILIALPCPCLHSCRRVATPRRTRTAVSATFLSASCFRRRVHVLPASRSRIGSDCSYSDSGSVSAHNFMSACRRSLTHPRRRVRDVHIAVTTPSVTFVL